MAEYIERAPLLDEIERDRRVAKAFFKGADEPIDVLCDSMRDTVKLAQTAAAAPVVHAHWIPMKYSRERIYMDGTSFRPANCSACGRWGQTYMPGCPWCKAWMDEEVGKP